MATATVVTEEKRPVKKRPRAQSAKFPRSAQFSYDSAERLKQLEKGFILDGVPMSHLVNDETGRTNPSINMGIPQYHALDDKSCAGYFQRKGLPKIVKKAKEGEVKMSSMMGDVFDRFLRSTEARQYLHDRHSIGAGYTRRLYGGHLTVPTAPPKVGYHGDEGYRRNTPELRSQRSVFDYEDPFDTPKPINRRIRTQSAPATMRLMRQKSASVYRAHPGGPRAVSAMPQLPSSRMGMRELATGPIT